MKVFQIGAAGGIGRRVSALLQAGGDEATGMHRVADQAVVVGGTGATPVQGDLVTDSVQQLAARMAGHDAVVFSAGAHGTGAEQTTQVDGKGPGKAAEAAQMAGIRRFVLVSVFPEAWRERPRVEAFEHYMREKKAADVALVRTGLDWVIIRPGTLKDDPGDGRVTAGPAVRYGTVSRDDVAAFIVQVLHTPEISREIIEVTDGPTPVDEAVAEIVALRRP